MDLSPCLPSVDLSSHLVPSSPVGSFSPIDSVNTHDSLSRVGSLCLPGPLSHLGSWMMLPVRLDLMDMAAVRHDVGNGCRFPKFDLVPDFMEV